jgi:hypothetical protein
MKKAIVASILALATFAAAQDNQAAGQSAGGQTQPGAAQTQPGAAQPQGQAGQGPDQAQQKVIKDPSEYNAYMSASQQQNPQQKAAAFEQFLTQYPNTVVKEEALEQLMASYQAAGDAQKMQDAANRLLQANPNNIRALALLTYFYRFQGQGATNPADAQRLMGQAGQLAQRGMQAAQQPKPAGVPDADWKKLTDSVSLIFQGALGLNALQQKDYPTAQKNLLAVVQAQGPQATLQDVYPLAQAYILADPKMNDPQQAVNGLWFAARSAAMAQPAGPQVAKSINDFGLFYYKRYHGGDDGWQQLIQQAGQSPLPPQGFTIQKAPPPPTPAEFANQIMQKYNNDPSQMAYEDWLFILNSGNQQAAQTVWTFLNGKLLPVNGKVVAATPQQVQLATTEDDKNENKADVTIQMAAPLKTVPAVGAATELVGKVNSYVTQPSLMVTLTEGKPKTAAPAPNNKKKPTPRRGTTTRKKTLTKK